MVDDIPEKVDKDESTITAGGTRKKLIKHFSALSLVTTKTFFVAECFFCKNNFFRISQCERNFVPLHT